MNIKNRVLAALTILAVSLPVGQLWAHGGVSVEIDSCRIPVGDQWVHFTAYTPTLTGDAEWCNKIPNRSRTNLVFDYEGKKLRKLTVEFEITKEPEGTVIYHQDPTSHKTGTNNVVVDFSQHPAGKYLAHVTLINGEDRTDAHMPFTVGDVGASTSESLMIVLLLLGILVGAYFFVPQVREKVDGIIKKDKKSDDAAA